MTPEQLREFERLLIAYGSARWDDGFYSASGQHAFRDEANSAAKKAREAVIAFVKELGK